MAYSIAGSSSLGFADALIGVWRASAALTALVGTQVHSSLPRDRATALPYVLVGRRDVRIGSVAMQKDGGESGVWVDAWSDENTPGEISEILNAMRAACGRDVILNVPGFTMYAGSLACDDEQIIQESDGDMPQRAKYHGVQHWIAEFEVA